MPIPTRDEAFELLTRYNHAEKALRHASAVETVMRHFASRLGHAGDADTWAIVGLVHDLDYEQFPEQHCQKTQQIL